MTSVITNVILVLHIILGLALTGAVMLQRSEGGALGIGGGGAGGGLMSGRGVAGALVRTTMFLAVGFFATSLALTTIANRTHQNVSAVESESDENDQPRLDEDGGLLPTISPLGVGDDEPEAQPDGGDVVIPGVPSLDEPTDTTEPEGEEETPEDTGNPQE